MYVDDQLSWIRNIQYFKSNNAPSHIKVRYRHENHDRFNFLSWIICHYIAWFTSKDMTLNWLQGMAPHYPQPQPQVAWLDSPQERWNLSFTLEF